MRKYRVLTAALVMLLGAYIIGIIISSNSSSVKRGVLNNASNERPSPKGTGQSSTRVATAESVEAKTPGNVTAQNNAASSVGAKGSVASGVESWSKVERHRQIVAGVDQTFSKAIAGLGLSENDQGKLRSLLIERAEAAWDAHDIATEGVAPNQSDLNQALKIAEAISKEDMANTFSPVIFEKIQSMIEAAPYIRQITQQYDPAMAQAGVPLTPEQVLPLSEILYHTFGSINNPQIEENRHQIDPATGLTPLDVLALERSKAVLSPTQLEIVRQKIAAINRAYYLRTKS